MAVRCKEEIDYITECVDILEVRLKQVIYNHNEHDYPLTAKHDTTNATQPAESVRRERADDPYDARHMMDHLELGLLDYRCIRDKIKTFIFAAPATCPCPSHDGPRLLQSSPLRH